MGSPRVKLDFSKHKLEVILESEKVKCYRCRNPENGRFLLFQITQTPEGVSISGDITPCGNGVHSSYRPYTAKWFSNATSPCYLSEKFLEKKWTADKAHEDVFYLYEEGIISHDSLKILQGVIDEGEYEFARALEEVGYVDWEYYPGWGYAPNEVSILCQIQETFSRLYKEYEKDCEIKEQVRSTRCPLGGPMLPLDVVKEMLHFQYGTTTDEQLVNVLKVVADMNEAFSDFISNFIRQEDEAFMEGYTHKNEDKGE